MPEREVRSPSQRRELVGVIRVGVAVLAVAWIYAGSQAADTSGTRGLLTYQGLMADLPAGEQLLFRELQEGLLEAERDRAVMKRWPDPSALEADGIPPFARDATTKGPTYAWRRLQNGTTVNYLGIPSASDAPAWLLLIQEPEPGSPPDPAPDDEEHHRLPDGIVLHISVWKHADGSRLEVALAPLPQARGWVQIVGRAPVPAVATP